jgi:hypothetical protein
VDITAERFGALSCAFKSADYGLVVSSANVTVDQFRERWSGRTTDTRIDSRDAAVAKDPAIGGGCFLGIQAPDGILIVQTDSRKPELDACAPIQQIGSVLATALPRG